MSKFRTFLLAWVTAIAVSTAVQAAPRKPIVVPAPQHQNSYEDFINFWRHGPNDVWVNGQYVGSDPDPLVRDMLRRENQ